MTETVRKTRSYTQIDTYKRCPELYRIKYVLRLREEPSVWSVGGVAFHQVAEWYLGGDLGEHPEGTRITNAWETAWELALDEAKKKLGPEHSEDVTTWRAANRGKEDASWWYRAGRRMVAEFIDWKSEGPGRDLTVFSEGDRKFLEAELRVEFGADVPVVAVPDWLAVDEHGQLCIVDYKTGKPPRQSYQLGVYRAALLRATGLDAQWGLYYMARDVRLIPADLTRYDPAAIEADFTEIDARINAGEFDPTPGEPCKFCPFKRTACRYYNPEVS
jgi:RecB family exonuclease